ncbi:MAG TPA: dihydrolipoamide acetyltransferase family protein [Pyrinomonadaceae bacterium]|nr:dihydrolipoamide acetyltransferase family protein [Pyrinomonadaceae bacterium]
MATEVVMPQMGESIAEGTITRWLKQVGESIDRDENLFEISTDKVDAEIPSPAAGVLLEIRAKEGETVEVGSVVAVVGEAGEQPAAGAASGAAAPPPQAAQPATTTPASQSPATSTPPPPQNQPQPSAQSQAAPQQQQQVAEAAGRGYDAERPGARAEGQTAGANGGAQAQSATAGDGRGEPTVEELRRTRSSPLVRKIAQEHNIDISRLEGTGASGRVTKNDILSFIESGGAQQQQAAQGYAAQPAAQQAQAQAAQPGAGDRVEPMSVMRRKIAEHMVVSRRTSAHVTTVYEIDMTRVARLRERHKAEFQQRTGTKLTFMPFIFQAVTRAIRKFPVLNSQVSGDQIIYKQDINLGMAVALDWGLIVPVIKRADDLSISGLAKAANDLAERARAKQLKPDDVAGGTFTITNPGGFGGLFGTPIINQPQVAILGVGVIEKRPKVVTTEDGDDFIAIRHMAYFALSFDHRIIDGADAERFLSYVKEILEAGQFQL